MTFERRTKYLAIVTGVLFLFLVIRGCLHKEPVTNKPVVSADFPSTDTVRVAMRDSVLEVQTATTTKYEYVPEEGQAVIEIKKDGTPVITVKNKGFTRKLGIDVFAADKLRIGGDCELAYWNRLGVHIGVGIASSPLVVGFVAGSYQLDQLHLNNTSMWVGYTTNKNLAIGLRVAF